MKQYLILFFSLWMPLFAMGEPIDRETVVKRHKVFTTATLPKSPAQVGNGKFAFGMDITGLQTFLPFNTLSGRIAREEDSLLGSGSSTSGDNQLVDAESTPH